MSASSQGTETDESSEQHSSLRRDLPARISRLFAAEGLDATHLEYVGQGLSNLVFSFRCALPGSSVDVERLVIRVQKAPVDIYIQQQMVNLGATLRFVRQTLPMIPRILRMDITSDNDLQRAYMIMSYLEGRSLDEVLRTVSSAEGIHVCKKVAKVLHEIQSITFTGTGPLHAVPDNLERAKIGHFEDYDQSLPTLDESTQPLLSSWLSLLFSWRIEMEDEAGIELMHLKELQHMLSQMVESGYFTEYDRLDRTVLSHSDLHGGNILLDRGHDGEWSVTGIIDWENARAMPRVLAPCSLEWMWSDELYQDGDLAFLWTGDLDFVSEANAAGISVENQQLKEAIDEYMASMDLAYMDIVYGRGRWIRRIAKSAIHGWRDNRDDTMTEWLIEEWAKHKPLSTT